MLLTDKVALVYGAGGSVGGAVAHTFAREGARVYLAGRRQDPLDAVASEIRPNGGAAEVATVDAANELAVEAHAATSVVSAYQDGGVDAYGRKPELRISDGAGIPCRHCLADVDAADEYLVLAHRPFSKNIGDAVCCSRVRRSASSTLAETRSGSSP